MKKIILSILIILISNSVNAENIYSGLNKLENQLFSETYEYELPQTRIERLEKKLFGAYQSGSIDERYTLLKNASKNYRAYDRINNGAISQYQRPLFTGAQGSNWKNMLWNNMLRNGGLTGFTPVITPAMDPAYMDYFEAERAMSGGYGSYSDYRYPRGYRTTRTNRGARTGVTILD